jgi:hypothetical protein
MPTRWAISAGSSERCKPLLLLCAGIAALWIGFIAVPPALCGSIITRFGYYYILGTFSLWVLLAYRVARNLPRVEWCRWRLFVFLLLATAFSASTDNFRHKILYDEYVVQGTAWHIHISKEIATPTRAFDFAGTWVDVTTYLDKRPYFFAFLVSLVHDLTGFRLGNAFAVNIALSFIVLTALFVIVRLITGRDGPAKLAVVLMATLPLFGQNVTGASVELLNIVMIALLLMTALLFANRPTPDRLSLLVVGAILLAQTRYESVLFVVPTAVLILFSWFRCNKVLISWPTVIAPLLLIPYAWHDRYVNASPALWELRAGEESRFSFKYLLGNLEGAKTYFLSTSAEQSNSIYLVLIGSVGVIWALVKFFCTPNRSKYIKSPSMLVVVLFTATIGVNLGLLMFYYWSRLDEPVAARFALPSFLIGSVIAGWFLHSIDSRKVPSVSIATFAAIAWLLIFGFPAYAQRLYTTRNLIMQELRWEREQYISRQGPIFVITCKASLPFLLERIPGRTTDIARHRGAEIAWHIKEGTFREILVSQVIRPTSAAGDFAVDPQDELPESFKLEELAMKRFGARWVRISRLISIDSS